MTWHQTIVIGNIGNIRELQYLQSGTAVFGFSLAANESWKDRQSGERREKTTWYNVSVWGAQAETCARFLSAGRQVMVVGTVEARAYAGKDGQPAASLDLRATEVRFLGGRDGGGQGQGQGGNSNDYEDFAPPPRDMNDIPF